MKLDPIFRRRLRRLVERARKVAFSLDIVPEGLRLRGELLTAADDLATALEATKVRKKS